MNKVGTSYAFWLFCLVGLGGVHRLYNGKVVTGILWLFTWGFFGFGQFVDLFLIPSMVDEYNLKMRARFGVSPQGIPLAGTTIQMVIPPEALTTTSASPTVSQPAPSTANDLMMKLLQAAAARDGRLSVTQAVLDTGHSFQEVEKMLQEMVKTGYVAIENHPQTGVILYNFLEL